jgi:hypothetical protein
VTCCIFMSFIFKCKLIFKDISPQYFIHTYIVLTNPLYFCILPTPL